MPFWPGYLDIGILNVCWETPKTVVRLRSWHEEVLREKASISRRRWGDWQVSQAAQRSVLRAIESRQEKDANFFFLFFTGGGFRKRSQF